MSAISELMQAAPEDFVRKMLPSGEYLCQIVEAEVLHGYWKANANKGTSARWFEAYVPTIEIVDYVENGDEEIDQETKAALELFGDWKGYQPPNGRGSWTQMQTVPGYDTKIKCAGIANGLNFVLAEVSPEWESYKELASSAARFFTSKNSRNETDGWVVKTLSTDPEVFTPPDITSNTALPEIIEKTKGCYLLVTLEQQEDENGVYEPKLVCTGTASV